MAKSNNPSEVMKGDFVEIDFTARVKDGKIFDTNIKEVADKEGLGNIKSLIICVGQSMVVAGFDAALEGKETGKPYTIELAPKDAFGDRQPSLVRTMPLRVFHEHKIDPQPGMSFLLDNYLVKVNAVSGGRVIADFNNPLAGKTVIYEFTIKRKVENPEQKVKAVMNFFFNKEFPFTIKENKVIINLDKNKPEEANDAMLLEMMQDKFKTMVALEVSVVASERPIESKTPAPAQPPEAKAEKSHDQSSPLQPQENPEPKVKKQSPKKAKQSPPSPEKQM